MRPWGSLYPKCSGDRRCPQQLFKSGQPLRSQNVFGPVHFDMLSWEKPAFDQPYELWREEGVLHLVLAKGAHVQVKHMKEFIRLVAAMDRSGRAPVVMEYPEHVVVDERARALLRRVCGAQGHPVALFASHFTSRVQAELFKHVERPAFPFRVFTVREAAFRWARERRQLASLLLPVDRDR